MMRHYHQHKKQIKLTNDEGPSYKMESLPPNMIAISNEVFVHVRYCLGHVRVQICRYSTDSEGYLHPTRDNISLSPLGWTVFLEKIFLIEKKHILLNVEPDMYIRHERSNGRSSYILQHMFFVNFVRLCEEEFGRLKEIIQDINIIFLEIFLKQKLLDFYMTKSDKRLVDYLESQVFFPEEAPDFTRIRQLILQESQVSTPAIDNLELKNMFQTQLKNVFMEKIHEHSTGPLCFNELIFSMDLVKIATDFQQNSLSKIDWFYFYESMNFCELLIDLREDLINLCNINKYL